MRLQYQDLLLQNMQRMVLDCFWQVVQRFVLDALSTSHSTFFRSLLGTFLLPESHVEFVLLRLYGPHLRWLNNQLRLIWGATSIESGIVVVFHDSTSQRTPRTVPSRGG